MARLKNLDGLCCKKRRRQGSERLKNKQILNLLRDCRRCTRLILVVLGRILFLSLYLPHTWGGEENLEEYFKILKHIGKNMQDIKQKYQTTGITAGMDAQVKVKPRQGPLVGDGTGMSRGSTLEYCETEDKLESLLMECITKHEVQLANSFCEN